MLNFCILKKTPPSAVPTAPSNGEVAAVQSRICKRSLRTFPRGQSYEDLPGPQHHFVFVICVCVCVSRRLQVSRPLAGLHHGGYRVCT